MSETIVTRRRAIGTTGTLFLGAGLLGATPTVAAQPAAAAEPLAIPTVLPQVVSTDDLAADCVRLLAQLKREGDAYWEAEAALKATLFPAQVDLFNKVSDADSDREVIYQEWIAAEMARHAPGLSTIIHLLWVHAVAEGDECRSFCHPVVAEGVEP